jgi:hypothetical protein
MSRRIILLGSIFTSLLLHALQLYILQYQSLWFSTPLEAVEESQWYANAHKMRNEEILKEALSLTQISAESSMSHQTACNWEPKLEVLKTHFPQTLPKAPLQSGEEPKIVSLHPQFQSIQDKPLTDAFPYLLSLSPSNFSKAPPLPFEECSSPHLHLQRSALPKTVRFKDLKMHSCSDDFDTELNYFEDKNGEAVFALTLISRPEMSLHPLRQNYLFLIDKSNSIQKERLAATKLAVLKAIREISSEDRFNIIVFDQKIEKLSPSPIEATQDGYTKAQGFLDKVELGSFFSQTNLYHPLFLTIPFKAQDDEVYTAILLSDGEALAQKNMAESLLSDWTRMNDGKVSLYSLSMNDDNHLNIFDTLTELNRGKSVTSLTYRGLKRKLSKLIKTVRSPLAKNLSCHAVAFAPDAELELLTQTTPLFANTPFVILGKTRYLDDFVLFVQGRVNGRWLHIKKEISFNNAKVGSPAIQTQWASGKKSALYQQFLQTNDPALLAETQEIIQTYNLPELFE